MSTRRTPPRKPNQKNEVPSVTSAALDVGRDGDKTIVTIEPPGKRPRSTSRGRPANAKMDDTTIMNFLMEFKEEMKKDIAGSVEAFQSAVSSQFNVFKEELASVKKTNTELKESVDVMSQMFDEKGAQIDRNTKDSADSKADNP